MVLDPVTELDAGAFDQVAYRGYIPQMLAFPAIAVQVDALRNGLAAVIERAPFIGGEVYEDDEGWVKLRWRDDCSVDELLLVAEHPDLDYQAWRQRKFPVKEIIAHYEGAWSHHGASRIPMPIWRAKVVVMKGGATVCVWFHHTAMDGVGAGYVWEAWAAACRGDAIPSLAIQPRAYSLSPKARQMMAGLGDISQNPGYTAEKDYGTFPSSVDARFFLSNERLAKLKADVSPLLPEGQWVSTGDALTGLLWSTVARAQGRVHDLNAAVVVDGRSRLKDPPPPNYTGNGIYSIIAQDRPYTLALAAISIRNAIKSFTSNRLDVFAATISGEPRMHEVHGRTDGPFLVTNWAGLSLGVLDWGSAALDGARCERVAEPLPLRNNMAIILPRMSDGLHVILSLEQTSMDKVLSNGEFMKYVEWDGEYGEQMQMGTCHIGV